MRARFNIVFLCATLGVMSGVGTGSTHSTRSTRTKVVRLYLPREGAYHRDNPFNLQTVARRVSAGAPARAVLRALLHGPTASERKQGFHALDSENLAVGSLTIRAGVARVDFVSQGAKAWAGDLSPATFKQAVERTLRQFSTVRRVRVTVNGRTDFDSSR